MTRTLEERLKYDSGLTIGRHLVEFVRGAEDMYSSWKRMNGDMSTNDGAILVWAARNAEFKAQYDEAFSAAPTARVEL